MSKSKSLTANYSLVQAAFWMNFCLAVSFAAVYLQGLGYSNTQLGAVMAIGNTLGALLGPALSAIIDRSEKLTPQRFLAPLLALEALVLILLAIFPLKGWLTTVCYVLYLALCLPVNSLNLKLYVDISYLGVPIDYGFTRGIGSLAYVVISTLMGALVGRSGVHILPYTALAMCALQYLVSLLLCRKIPASASRSAGEVTGNSMPAFVKNNYRFCILLFGTILIFYAHNTLCNFMINIAVNVGGNTETMGYLNGFMALVEIPVILLYRKIRGRHSNAEMLRFAFVFFGLKAFAFAAAPNVPFLFASMLFQAPSFALYSAAIVEYVEEAIPHEDSAKAQSLAFSMTTVGSVFASVISGRLFDSLSVTSTMFIAAFVAALGALIAILGVKRKA